MARPKAIEMLISQGDKLKAHYETQRRAGTIDVAGRKYLLDWERERAKLLSNLAAKDQTTVPVRRAAAHSKMVSNRLADRMKGRNLTKIPSSPKRSSGSVAAIIGILPSEEIMERIEQRLSSARNSVLESIGQTATLHTES